MKKFLKISGLCLVGLVLLAFFLPFFFKDKIIAKVQSEINQNLNATVAFGETSLSLFRSFPRLSLRLENLHVTGRDEFAKDTLMNVKQFDVAVNLMSLFSDQMEIYKVNLESPRIHALVHKNGKANWDITLPDTVTVSNDTSTTRFQLNLKAYSIHDGYVFYEDETAGMKAEIFGLDHEGSGDFNQDQFKLSTSTRATSASFSYEGIPYLSHTKAEISSDILVDQKTGTYQFDNADVNLNNLLVKAAGYFRLASDSSYDMDIKFNAPSTDFKDLLSLVPSIYQSDFKTIQTSGKALFNGFVKGTYSPSQMPAYDVNLKVQDGSFQYPDLPKPLENIQVDLRAFNPDGVMDHTELNISKAHFEMDHEPFDLSLILKNPESQQYIDARAKGKVDLGQIGQFVKLPQGTQLKGLLNADLFAKGNMKEMNQSNSSFQAGGMMQLSDLFYAAKEFPRPVSNGRMMIRIENQGGIADATNVRVSEAHIELGNDPFDFNINLSHPLSSMDCSGDMKGRMNLADLAQFGVLPAGARLSGTMNADLSFAGNKAMIDRGAYDEFQLQGNTTVSNVSYQAPEYPGGITVKSAALQFNPSQVRLSNLEAAYLNSNFSANGSLDNLIGYALKDQTLKGALNLKVDQMNLNQWMGSSETAATDTSSAAMAPFAIPANLDLALVAEAGTVSYDKVKYNNVRGRLQVKDEKVTLQDLSTEALDGNISFNGYYSTRASKQNPDISLQYKVQNVDIQKAFLAFNTVQKLMPAAQYLSGRLSSSLQLNGKLGSDLIPQMSSLAGNGNMLLLEGVLKQFAPLEKIASTLQVAELKEISLKDLKSSIEFSNGKVLVKPFSIKVKDIEMQIGGMHGFDQKIDYVVQMKLPRKYLGSQGNQLVDGLALKASNKGIPVKLGETVNLNIHLSGSMTSPSIQTDLKESAGDAVKELQAQAMDFAKQKVDSAKQTLKDSAVQLRKQVTSEVKDELKSRLLGSKDSSQSKPLDSVKAKTVESVKNTFGKLLGKKKG